MRIEIQPAGPEFAPVITALYGACFSPVWRESAIVGLLTGLGGRGWAATCDGRPVGFALVRQAADEAEILAIGVLPSDRKRGIGRALLAAMIDDCRANGASRLYLEVAASNNAARQIYQAAGFAAVGRRNGYYRTKDAVEDAVIMRRDLM